MHATGTSQEAGVTGVILAGGRSRRYGMNKAFVKIEGTPLIERVTGVMESCFEQVFLITNTPDEYDYLDLPMVKDRIKGLGPLGGIFTALKTVPTEAAFFVACDMPFLNPSLICRMVEIRDDFDAVVPRVGGKVEALHALYSKRCLPAVSGLIERGEYQVFQFFSEVSVRYVEEAEIRGFDPELGCFLNINRREEARAWQER